MAELADAPDLGSGVFTCRFDSCYPHHFSCCGVRMNNIIKGMGFHHIALEAQNFDKTLMFYKALGMTEIARWGSSEKTIAMLNIGDGGIIEIFSDGGDRFAEVGKWAHFALSVEDVDRAYETAINAGAAPMTPPKTVALESSPNKMTIRIAFVKGPDNEQIEFFKIL